jgi:chromosomal replication initiation ATPase DnaA|tara:strand:- start:301 stop:813 length:513 start_codon:yes stop_codon:yes gene_type:complete
MHFLKQEFKKHIKKINNNDFIYEHKVAFYLLSDSQLKLYEDGFKNGYQIAHKKISKEVLPKNIERKIIGYQFRKPKQFELDSIINKVCIKYEVKKKDLLGKQRTKDIVRARNIIHNIFNEKYKMSLTDIGKIFNQDHTTVNYSIQMKYNKRYYWSVDQTIWQEFNDLIKS